MIVVLLVQLVIGLDWGKLEDFRKDFFRKMKMKRIFDLLEDIKKLKIIEYFIYLKIL